MLVAVVVSILGIGWYMDNVARAQDTVAVVAGHVITTRDVLDEMRPMAAAIDAQAKLTLTGARGSAAAQQIADQKRGLPDQALDSLVDDQIIRQEAARRGITVTPQDVDARMRRDISEITALSAPVPTPEASPEASPTATAGATPQATPSPTPVPTLQPDAYQQALKDQLGPVGISEERYRLLVERDLYREKLQEAIGAEVPTSQEQFHVRHVLLPDENTAKKVLERLQNGEDFATVAKEMSTDPGSKDKGGDLGWAPKGIFNDAFQNAALALQPGQRSDIVKSPNGYHIIEMIERDPNRPVAPDQLEMLKTRAFSEWLTNSRNSSNVKLEFASAERDWTLRQIGVRPQ